MGLREPPPDVGEMDLLEQLQLGVEVVYDRPLAEAEGRRDIADARLGIPVSRHHFGEHPQDVVPRVIALPRRHQFRLKAARNAFRPRLPAMAVATGIAWWWTVSAGMSTSRGQGYRMPRRRPLPADWNRSSPRRVPRPSRIRRCGGWPESSHYLAARGG